MNHKTPNVQLPAIGKVILCKYRTKVDKIRQWSVTNGGHGKSSVPFVNLTGNPASSMGEYTVTTESMCFAHALSALPARPLDGFDL